MYLLGMCMLCNPYFYVMSEDFFLINWSIFFVYRCLHSLIHLRPRRLIEGRELTRQLRKSQTRFQFWVYLRLEKQGAANILPCPLMQPQAVKTFVVHGRRMIGSFLQTVIARNFKKPQEKLSFLEKGWRGRWLDVLHLLPPGVHAFHSVKMEMEWIKIPFTHPTQAQFQSHQM